MRGELEQLKGSDDKTPVLIAGEGNAIQKCHRSAG
jgi:hypothetical protein